MEMIPELVDEDENSNNEERDVVIVEDVFQERTKEDTTNEDDDIKIATEDTTHEDDDIRSVAEEMEEENKDVPNENVAEGSEATGMEYNLRSIHNMDYSHRLDHIMYNPASNQSYDVQLLKNTVTYMHKGRPTQAVFKHVTGIIITKMTAKGDIKMHRKSSVTATFDEFFQLDDKVVFEGSNLTRKQKHMALRAIK